MINKTKIYTKLSIFFKKHQSLFLLVFLAGYFFMPSSKSHNNLFYILILAPTFFIIDKEDLKQLLKNKAVVSLLLFMAYFILSGLWSGALKNSSSALKYSLYILSFGFNIFYFIKNEKQSLRYINWLYWSSVTYATGAIIHFQFFKPGYRRLCGIGTINDSIIGRLDHPNLAGALLGTFVLVGYMLYINHQKRSLIGCAILMYSVWLTQSRAAFISTAVILLALTIYSAIKTRFSKRIRLILVIFTATIVCANFYSSRLTKKDMGKDARWDIWTHVITKVKDKPLIGYGFGSDNDIKISESQIYNHSHNFFIGMSYYGGLIGLGLLLLWLFYSFRNTYLAKQWPAIFIAIFGIMCCSADIDCIITNPREYWLYFWVPVFVCMFKPQVEDSEV